MNKQCLKVADVTESDYRRWCRDYHKSKSYAATKQEFFKLILEGRLIRDDNGKFIYKKEQRTREDS